MAKKPFSLENFLKKSSEEQAKAIERETRELLKRLPALKRNLQMYGEVSDELYNLAPEEVELAGSKYAQAVRSGEITTPTSQRAYQKFIRDLHRYTRPTIRDLAVQTAEQRMSSWLDTIKSHGSQAEIDYATELLEKMSPSDKIGFTRSKYFLDTENWNSQDTFTNKIGEDEYSIMTLKLELYLEEKGISTNNLYKENIGEGTRKYRKKRRR